MAWLKAASLEGEALRQGAGATAAGSIGIMRAS